MTRSINYLFCRYSIDGDAGSLDEAGEFAFLSEHQGGEYGHGRERQGTLPQVLCTDPKVGRCKQLRVHTFGIGYKPGIRVRQEYDRTARDVVRSMELDAHTKFGQFITVPSLQVMAIRDRASDDTLNATTAIGALRSFVRGASDEHWHINVIHAGNDDVEHALDHWRISEYSYTVRPLNPTGGDLAKMRTEMYKKENIGQESGVVKAASAEGLRTGNGTIGQTRDLVHSGYGQNGLKGTTEDGNAASIPKLPFSQDKKINLKKQASAPRFIRIAFNTDDTRDDISLDVASALVRFYRR